MAPEEPLRIAGDGPRFVSRGGEKLDAALGHFGIDVAGRSALDAGASTGGFTDCLLQRGAERVNARTLEQLPFEPELVVCDVSFISVRTALPPALRLAKPGWQAVVLVKPQFEAGRREASRGRGVIRDPEVWERVVAEVAAAFASEGSDMMGTMRSPLTGADGNVEFLLHLRGREA